MLSLLPVAMSQTTTAQNSGPASSEIPEEIVVYGKRSLIHLRQELYTAEENFFAVFNSLNSDDEYDVNCKYVFRIRAHRRVRECKANFLMKYENDFFMQWNPNLATLQKKEKLLVEEMRTQVSEHPELLEVFTDLAEAKHDYDSARQSRHK